MNLIQRVGEFAEEVPPCLRLLQRPWPKHKGAFVFDLYALADFLGAELFEQAVQPGGEDIDIQFLWRPRSKRVLWDAVRTYKLQLLDGLGPAVRGLLVRWGRLTTPTDIVYDHDAAKLAFAQSFRDPLLERRRDYELRLQQMFNDACQRAERLNGQRAVMAVTAA